MNTRMMFARVVVGAVKVIVALALVAVLLGVLAAVEMDQSDKWHGGAIFVAVVVPLIAIQFYSFARQSLSRE